VGGERYWQREKYETLLLIKNSSAQTSDGRLAVTLIYEGHSARTRTRTHAHTHTHTSTHTHPHMEAELSWKVNHKKRNGNDSVI